PTTYYRRSTVITPDPVRGGSRTARTAINGPGSGRPRRARPADRGTDEAPREPDRPLSSARTPPGKVRAAAWWQRSASTGPRPRRRVAAGGVASARRSARLRTP